MCRWRELASEALAGLKCQKPISLQGWLAMGSPTDFQAGGKGKGNESEPLLTLITDLAAGGRMKDATGEQPCTSAVPLPPHAVFSPAFRVHYPNLEPVNLSVARAPDKPGLENLCRCVHREG